jgi:predicted ester cyclase
MLEDGCIRSQYDWMHSLLQPQPGALVEEHRLNAPHPVNEGDGADFYSEALSEPLRRALSGAEQRNDIRIEGTFGGARWRASSGHIAGRFVEPLFGIPADGRIHFLRFGCFERLEGERIGETILLLDLPSLMIETGCWPLAAPLGPTIVAPSPAVRDDADAMADPAVADRSLKQVEAMIGGLMRYDGRSLASMGMRNFWTPHFSWYGPAPIGSFKGHEDYERGHQGPFLAAFPDRVGGNHRARIAQGSFVASTGWPSINATHSGGDWLGLAPTGKRISMRVMDFWRSEGDLLAENWVMIDIPHLLEQFGIDIFARMNALIRA